MNKLRKPILLIALALVVMGVPACGLLQQAEGPTVTVASPENFAKVQVGESVDVVSTATDPKGVTRVELWVGEDLYLTDASPSPEGERTWTLIQTWTPSEPGFYTLTVVAYNVDEVEGVPFAVAIEAVEGTTTEGTPAPTVQVGTPPPPTATPPPGATTAPTPPTSTVAPPPPPTNTPVPPPPPTDTPVPLPDLYIAEVALDPPSPVVGEPVDVRIVVVNGGTASVEEVYVNLVEKDNYHGEIWQRLGPLAAGGQLILEDTYRFKIADPTNRTLVCVDCYSQATSVEESNEENNGYVLMVNVQPAVAEPLPDLYISRVSLDPVSPRVGEEVQVEVEITNGGPGDAGPHTAQWKSDPDTVACMWGVDGVPAGMGIIKRCTYAYTYPHSGQSTYTTADANGDVEESDEDNNVRYLRVNVRPAS
jgi:hypothetical protein